MGGCGIKGNADWLELERREGAVCLSSWWTLGTIIEFGCIEVPNWRDDPGASWLSEATGEWGKGLSNHWEGVERICQEI